MYFGMGHTFPGHSVWVVGGWDCVRCVYVCESEREREWESERERLSGVKHIDLLIACFTHSPPLFLCLSLFSLSLHAHCGGSWDLKAEGSGKARQGKGREGRGNEMVHSYRWSTILLTKAPTSSKFMNLGHDHIKNLTYLQGRIYKHLVGACTWCLGRG